MDASQTACFSDTGPVEHGSGVGGVYSYLLTLYTSRTQVLQNMANMTEFGQKEGFMAPCNSFLIANRKAMQQVLDDVSVRSLLTAYSVPGNRSVNC